MGNISERADRFVRNVYGQRRKGQGQVTEVSDRPHVKVDWKKIKQQRDSIRKARGGY